MLSFETLPSTVENFFTDLCHLPYIKRIILYGSRARGDQRERSDIDLAIDCPYASHQQWLDILEHMDQAETLLEIDCVRYDQLAFNSPLKHAIDRDGIELYRKIP